MAEEPLPMTLQQRIAALNASHIGRTPGESPPPRSKPQVPVKRPLIIKQNSVNTPPAPLNGSISDTRGGSQPAGPVRPTNVLPPPPLVRESSRTSTLSKTPPPLPRREPSLPPPLPVRQVSQESSRRGSIESTGSVLTDGTGTASDGFYLAKSRSKSSDRLKAPAWGETELPALPPRGAANAPRTYSSERPKYVNRVPSCTATAEPGPNSTEDNSRPTRPSLPPRLPSRKKSESSLNGSQPVTGRSKPPPMPSAAEMERIKLSTLAYLNQSQESVPAPAPAPVASSAEDMEKVSLSTFAYLKQPRDPAQMRSPAVPAKPARPKKPNNMVQGEREKIQLSTFASLNKSHNAMPSVEPPQDVQASPLPSIQPTQNVQASPAPPPPIPINSRPDLSAIHATKPGHAASTSLDPQSPTISSTSCMVCRDFSAPDHHATLFPRHSVASLPTLAANLTSPFPSHTDKARAIFTWLHHNVLYDVRAFFSHSVQPSTPQSTLSTGLAVCEGYAALFANLATHAGLEALVISGHGKGYGYAPLAPNAPLPPYNAGHAWNAVRIDGGEWKLIDACWGAGHVQGNSQDYVQQFHAECFTMSNEEFGTKHFPGDKNMFFLPDGRRMAWEEYIRIDPARWPGVDEPPTVFTDAKRDYGIAEKSVMPRSRQLRPTAGGTVRFQFGLLCPHYTLERHVKKGLPPVFLLMVHGRDGRKDEQVPLEHLKGTTPGGGGDTWVADINAVDLGAPGQTVTLFAVTSFGHRKDARGLTVKEFREGIGRVGMFFAGVAAWELA